jgi:hypothetical protein
MCKFVSYTELISWSLQCITFTEKHQFHEYTHKTNNLLREQRIRALRLNRTRIVLSFIADRKFTAMHF